MSASGPPDDRRGVQSKRHRVTVGAVLITVCVFEVVSTLILGSGSSDTILGIAGIIGIVMFSAALVATLRSDE
jgi:Na+/melibiose symporter-like transporter